MENKTEFTGKSALFLDVSINRLESQLACDLMTGLSVRHVFTRRRLMHLILAEWDKLSIEIQYICPYCGYTETNVDPDRELQQYCPKNCGIYMDYRIFTDGSKFKVI